MFLLIAIAVISSLFQKDHFRTLRNYILMLMITAFYRFILISVTHLPDSNPLCSTNQYPFMISFIGFLYSYEWLDSS